MTTNPDVELARRYGRESWPWNGPANCDHEWRASAFLDWLADNRPDLRPLMLRCKKCEYMPGIEALKPGTPALSSPGVLPSGPSAVDHRAQAQDAAGGAAGPVAATVFGDRLLRT